MARWQAGQVTSWTPTNGRASRRSASPDSNRPSGVETTRGSLAKFVGCDHWARQRIAQFRRLVSSQPLHVFSVTLLPSELRRSIAPTSNSLTLERPNTLTPRASGGSRTHTCRITGAVLGRLSFAGAWTLLRSVAKLEHPRRESNPILDVRSVACRPSHSEDVFQESGVRIRTRLPFAS
jgi:hypothetical protein